MNYLYTPYDIAVFLATSDFTQSDERAVLHDIWENYKDFIQAGYKENEILFKKHIRFELSKFEGVPDDLDELNLLMRDSEQEFLINGIIDEQNIIDSYFKIIKLELTYVADKGYRKIKLRRLLKRFGYERRSANLVANIQQALNALELNTYLKSYIPCNISEIGIDDMVMIRLNDKIN